MLNLMSIHEGERIQNAAVRRCPIIGVAQPNIGHWKIVLEEIKMYAAFPLRFCFISQRNVLVTK